MAVSPARCILPFYLSKHVVMLSSYLVCKIPCFIADYFKAFCSLWDPEISHLGHWKVSFSSCSSTIGYCFYNLAWERTLYGQVITGFSESKEAKEKAKL